MLSSPANKHTQFSQSFSSISIIGNEETTTNYRFYQQWKIDVTVSANVKYIKQEINNNDLKWMYSKTSLTRTSMGQGNEFELSGISS